MGVGQKSKSLTTGAGFPLLLPDHTESSLSDGAIMCLPPEVQEVLSTQALLPLGTAPREGRRDGPYPEHRSWNHGGRRWQHISGWAWVQATPTCP